MNQSSKDAIIWYTKVLIDVSDSIPSHVEEGDSQALCCCADEIRDIVYKIREELRDEES